jgi:hypothetical protein
MVETPEPQALAAFAELQRMQAKIKKPNLVFVDRDIPP